MKGNWPGQGALENDGFTIVETSICTLLILVAGSVALLNINAILPRIQANTALAQTVAQVRRGREVAISQRRNVEIRFLGTNQIQLVRRDEPAGETILDTHTFDNGFEFLLSEGTPDTPDRFGNSGALDFGGKSPVVFQSDGTLVDPTGNPLNGSIFVGLAGHPETARAVTILGSTGRVRGYQWTGTDWVH